MIFITLSGGASSDTSDTADTSALPLLETTTQAAALAVGAGIVSHLGYFIRRENHSNGLTIAVLHAPVLPVFTVFTVALCHYLHFPLPASAVQTLALVACYAAGLYGSMCVYRGVFHPPRNFDGPFLARFSNLYHSWLLVDKSDNYPLMIKLHQKPCGDGQHRRSCARRRG